MKITTTDHATSRVNILVYGEAGVGKTVLCATAPKPIILSAESGLLSLRGAGIPVIECNSVADIEEAYDYLLKHVNKRKYETVCIDSISELAETVLTEELTKTKDPRKAYGAMNDIMAGVVRIFRDLPMHSYFTAKVRKVVEEDSGAIVVMPSAPGQGFMQSLPYYFDEVAYMFVGRKPKSKETERRLQFVGTPRLVAKDRSGLLDMYEPPDLTALFNKALNVNNKRGKK